MLASTLIISIPVVALFNAIFLGRVTRATLVVVDVGIVLATFVAGALHGGT